LKPTIPPSKAVRAALFSALCTASLPVLANNEALLELFKIMRDKGSLSATEYELLVNTAKADDEHTEASKQQLKQEVDQKVAIVEQKTDKMAWAEKITLKGDLRTRYQYDDTDRTDGRTRGRLRYRLGVIAKPIDRVEVGAGMASGGPDPRSTNETFDNTFSTKDLRLDYAYMQYKFGDSLEGLTAIAGKFVRKNYLWAPTDVFWDTDLNPEGVAFNYMGTNAWGTYFGNTGIWVIDEQSANSDDPYLVYGQLGQSWKQDNWFGTVGGSIYSFSNIHSPKDVTFGGVSNTTTNLSSFNLAAEVGTTITDGEIALVGEFINNFETSSSADTAWALGMTGEWKKWGLKYIYADVETNAIPDFTPDSDRFFGLTGFDGHEVEVTYALMKNVSVGVDFYATKSDLTNGNQHVVQADLNVKF